MRVAIMGLHRGGTSAVAGVVHALGLDMGDDLLLPSEHNPKGYFESRRIMKLHTAMMGGDVWDPVIDVEPHLDEYDQVLGLLQEPWAVKDPRFCYLLPHLQDRYDRLIVVTRSIANASSSLHARGGHTEEEAKQLTGNYARRLFPAARGFPGLTTYVSYDSLIKRAWLEVGLLADWLGMRNGPSVRKAIDPSLRHWR